MDKRTLNTTDKMEVKNSNNSKKQKTKTKTKKTTKKPQINKENEKSENKITKINTGR